MFKITDLLSYCSGLHKIEEYAGRATGLMHVCGISGTGVPAAAAAAAYAKKQCIIMTASFEKGKKLCDDLSFFVNGQDKKIYLLPEENQVLLKYEAKSHTYLEKRLEAAAALISAEPCIVVGTPDSLLKKMVPKRYFVENILTFSLGDEIDLADVRAKLTRMGYERMDLVESKGQFSIRGDIIDVFAPNEKVPMRIEIFDTQIDSIRSFDPTNQRSFSSCEKINIYPAQQMVYDEERFARAAEAIAQSYDDEADKLPVQARKKIRERKEKLLEFIREGINLQLLESYLKYFYDETETIFDYADQDNVLIVDDPDRVFGRIELYLQELRADYDAIIQKGEALPEDFDIDYITEELHRNVAGRLTILLNPFAKTTRITAEETAVITVTTKQATSFFGKMDMLAEEIKNLTKRKYTIILSCSNDERFQNLKDFIYRSGISESAVSLVLGELSSGVEFIDDRLALISDKDIFVAARRRRTFSERKDAKPIKVFTEIRQGDYIVHENHGIGKFIGIEQKNFQGVTKDYLKIKYAGEDILYVPVGQMDYIQKYIGSDAAPPKISKMNSTEWKKTKIRAKVAIAQMAKELMEISAMRRMLPGYAFGADTSWQCEFEDMFEYVETDDQLQCIREIKQDMENPEIMDRLLCGDVGYGKTEVAARAAFKCTAEGKQVAVLVPTTILANQHYHTFANRFEKFPMRIEMLSRFRSDKQQKEIIESIKTGKLDIIIGTHRILSKDVEFKDLGLLIVDEEHRFGVRHKEVIKSLKSKVDVLTLSATPIPRTLHMSLSGIRNMSVISEPPEERYPVQTYVLEQDDEILKEIIRREIERDGQVFIVYNRVQGIKKVAAYIQSLVPEAGIAVGHGQMPEKELEDIMADFMENRYNVLIATTIIESGIDIANANTMIVLDSDKFGLSQLYQLRGRVGRSNRMAYAYLFYQRDKVLTEVAEKRLKAIREFTEFGSGFKIAMRDLEIRGAGNLLGTEQSGHMMTIGYELYCKLLDDAVKAFSGKSNAEDEEDDMLESAVELQVNAYISNEFITDEMIKLQVYKKISEINSEEDELDVKDELLDRFGDLPESVENLISVARIKSMAHKLGIQKVGEIRNGFVLEFYEKNKLAPVALKGLIQNYGQRITIHGGIRPNISCYIAPKQDKIKEIKGFLCNLLIAGTEKI